ncbi:hypothetical protein I6E68_05940 [Salinibacterium sp. NSLL150]|uniref:hypothetical protein n=1 Tax=unclassified Salinibacterium TaxID=2632331 RepID=UPI0018CD21D7|nr:MULTISPECIES: hypothetical protein [unclassified Salinibacterium]MBH0098681.1 hypothetical protein [Salinibacterium sp. NSLL35]MBH0101436.1 hypothetical protein [Salinibacterium sp. NSLL150]MBH0104195.1 hypothetical protein [Salinibacterium sp. NSLL16]MBH0106956.1 hypothetical protein [Salinibacterium sp. NSLL17]
MADIDQIVRDAVAEHPFPSSLTDADAQTQRRITREAEALGLDPEALFATHKAQTEDAIAFDADAIAADVRGNRGPLV